MSEHALTITYSGAAALEDTYWVRIEQDVVDEMATIADAASLLDALYDIDPCVASETTSEEPTTDLAAATEEALDLSYCDTEADGSVEVEIKIIRSHLPEPATLRLRGGEVVSVVQESGQITVSLEITTELTLTYPVVTGFRCTPAPQERNGNTLRFAEDQVGLIMTATYTSSWEVATIKVLGVDGDTGTCQALAFHHGVVADVEVQVPEGSEEDRSLCPAASWQPVSEQSQVTCYQDVVVSKKCSCSEEEVDTYTYQQVVPCPDREIKCPGVLTECMHFLGTVSVVERVDCATDSQLPGTSSRYKVNDPDYYRKVCCRDPLSDRPLPACPERRTTFSGSTGVEYGEQHWREAYGDNTRFVPVPPPGGICGEWIVRQEIGADCCATIPAPEWDWTRSGQVIADNSHVDTFWSQSLGPYTIHISGVGFWLDSRHTLRHLTTNDNSVVIYTTHACGSAKIVVTDACGRSCVGSVRSTNGKWVEVYHDEGNPGINSGHCQNSYWCRLWFHQGHTEIFGGLRQTVWSLITSGSTPLGWNWEKCPQKFYQICLDLYRYCDEPIAEAATVGPVPSLPDMSDIPCQPDSCEVGNCDFYKYIPVYEFKSEEWQC